MQYSYLTLYLELTCMTWFVHDFYFLNENFNVMIYLSCLLFWHRCGNINWAKRLKCNICNTNKPGHNEGGVRYYI